MMSMMNYWCVLGITTVLSIQAMAMCREFELGEDSENRMAKASPALSGSKKGHEKYSGSKFNQLFYQSSDLSKTLLFASKDDVDAIFSLRDESPYANPPLLHLVANAKIPQALALIDFVKSNFLQVEIGAPDGKKFNNPLTMAVAKGPDYFNNKYRQDNKYRPENSALVGELIDRILSMNVVDVNWQNSDGFTALHFAYLRRDAELVSKLSKAGSDPHLLNRKKLCPKDMLHANYEEAKKILSKQVGGIFYSIAESHQQFDKLLDDFLPNREVKHRQEEHAKF